MSLRLVPVTLREASAFVAAHHRHNEAPQGHRVSVGVADETGALRGVAILGRPLARPLDDGTTAEVLRVATDGARNACSMLYGAMARAAWALGYDRVITYTLASEPGTSLLAAGWRLDGQVQPPYTWDRSGQVRKHQRMTMFYEHTTPPTDMPRNRWAISRRRS